MTAYNVIKSKPSRTLADFATGCSPQGRLFVRLLPAEVSLDRIETALYHFADNVRSHEVNSPGPLRQGFPGHAPGGREGRQAAAP
jgi:hypothetical protein